MNLVPAKADPIGRKAESIRIDRNGTGGCSWFRDFFQMSGVGIVVVSPDQSILEANPSFCEFLGYSKRELVGRKIADIIHPDERERTGSAIMSMINGCKRMYKFQKRYIHKNGNDV
jgi:PAS domain S-box-containing protein